MADVLAGYVTSFPSSLHCMTTDKKVWFAAETKDTLAYAISNGLRDIGIISDDSKWLQDGAFDFEGKPIHTGPVGQAKWPGGSDWSSFSVERWRNAVYVTTKYFGELCEDTIKFIVEIAKQVLSPPLSPPPPRSAQSRGLLAYHSFTLYHFTFPVENSSDVGGWVGRLGFDRSRGQKAPAKGAGRKTLVPPRSEEPLTRRGRRSFPVASPPPRSGDYHQLSS